VGNNFTIDELFQIFGIVLQRKKHPQISWKDINILKFIT